MVFDQQQQQLQYQSTTNKRQIFDPPLSNQRYQFAENYISNRKYIESVTDLGCGEGRFLLWLKSIPHLKRINFVDFNAMTLDCDLNERFTPGLSDILLGRVNSNTPLDIRVYLSDMKIPDPALMTDCVTLIEVIEHIDLDDLDLTSHTVFGYYQPKAVIVTTPNFEFNHLLRQDGESPVGYRHPDHKFEWTRAQFNEWAQIICKNFPYTVSFDGVGHLPNSEPFGPCTQIAIFEKKIRPESLNRQLRQNYFPEDHAKLLTQNLIPGRIGGAQEPDEYEAIDWPLEYLAYEISKSRLDDPPEGEMDTTS